MLQFKLSWTRKYTYLRMYPLISKENKREYTNVVNLSEVQHLSQFVRQVYSKILEIYQQPPLPVSAPGATPVLVVEKFARELEPFLLKLLFPKSKILALASPRIYPWGQSKISGLTQFELLNTTDSSRVGNAHPTYRDSG